ncbi:hydantoinase B/oxoprolinase family protein [Sedimentitalea sp. JM2-8]|uniref:Hydantoinase B/oxoprolinase family protein n=1 Tax=Sedimentitalea xiamensis TaxID=3050037 RepID=A0ABT7FGH5_9RHOB|nr:hydantoinase B/oxoprolinase family protein [Sedimentitalea xiamensis]MDK3074244.1 hydantoinase B/oxoprolinase family protein [Sedimentitalea xiamensis]
MIGIGSTHKLLSENPERYADAAVQGIREMMEIEGPFPDNTIRAVRMGTTVATNALPERKGEPVLLLIAKGFRDLLEIGYQTCPRLFDLHIIRPERLYRKVAEMDERLGADGEVIRALDETATPAARQSAYDEGLRALAVAGLHAYLNPVHERRVADMARQIGLTQISTSHEVSKLTKLVGRGDTTVVDANLSPILRRYVGQVADALDMGRACERLLFMQSSGGLTDARLFQGKDAILSGPAGGIVGNTEVSQAMCNALLGALHVMAGSQATMNNFVWGNDDFQNYETIAGGTGAGPGFDGCDAIQTHMTNTRMTDPEILEKRFPVRLEAFGIREGSGGRGKWTGGSGATRMIRFLTPVTVTTLCSHREIPPFGVDGGAPGAVGVNWAELPDGRHVDLKGNDETDLPSGAVFGMHTPGGGGWGAP